ncbi:mechanosensitive ion channel [Gammaproteobacteria bacterium]|nr:mechanosensitive ion channel [Gammaproteobacteria bacterium]
MHKLIFILFFISFSTSVFSYPEELNNAFYLGKSKTLIQQIDLLKDRLAQSQKEYDYLQSISNKQLASNELDKVSKAWLKWIKIDMSVASSNLDTINIEISEAQQTITLLEKDIQEIENQINVVNIFNVNVSRAGLHSSKNLNSQLAYKKDVLRLEKSRLVYLSKLQSVGEDTLQLYTASYTKVENILKSQTILQLKEEQAKSEIDFKKQQNDLLNHLSVLHLKINDIKNNDKEDESEYNNTLNEIFYTNEKISYIYTQMLLVRYKDQIQQFKDSILHSSSIALLNKVSDQAQVLGKQLTKLQDLLKARIQILNTRKDFISHNQSDNSKFFSNIAALEKKYTSSIQKTIILNNDVVKFRSNIDHSLQHELSARQGLLGFSTKAWLDLGNEIILLPTLTFQVVKSLMQVTVKSLSDFSLVDWTILFFFEVLWVIFFVYVSKFMKYILEDVPDHELGHINPKWLSIRMLHAVLFDIALIANLYILMIFMNVSKQNFSFLCNLCFVWLFFKAILTLARLCLVETVHDRAGHDVRLFYRLKWTILAGGIITAFTVFLHQLPLVYEIKDLFYRLFLIFIAIVSLLLLKSWDVFPGLILHYVDDDRTYFKKIVRLLGFLIPSILLVNSVVGVFGFINFVLTMSWYESIFLLVLIGYLIIRGFLGEMMEVFSNIFIRHVSNGWLWTEAFLKPLDKILRLFVFCASGAALFYFYGWDMQSSVVQKLKIIFNYHLFDFLNTSITIISIIEVTIIVSILYWVGRWTREFMYRFLFTRTKDLGIRNSIAILTQYSMIVIGIFLGLRILGIDLHALTVVAGAFAFGIGLGLRDLANNFVCGFLLLFERPLRVGDTVTIGDNEGQVMHIGGRAITVRTWDHTELLVPNAEIFSKTFTNWTAKDHVVRTVISIKIKRQDSPVNVQDLIYQALVNHQDILTEPSPEVFLKELGENLIEFELRYYINLRQVKSRISVRSEILISIWEVFKSNGIQPPYPQHEILIKGNSPASLLSPVTNL